MNGEEKSEALRSTGWPHGTGDSLAHRRPVLIGLMLSMGLTAMDGTIVATAIPSIVRDLGGFSLFPWVFSIYLLAQAATIPVYGKLADLYGRKPVLMLGAGIFLLGSALSGLSWGMVPLIVFRGIQGLGAGAIQPIATTVVGDLYTVQERARVQGLLSSVWGISAILGPTIGGLLVQYVSWHWIFYINLPLGAAALVAVGTYLHEVLERRRHRIDYAGSILLTVGMVLIILELLEAGVAWPWWSWRTAEVLGPGLVLLGAFLAVERTAAEPVLPLWVFQRRALVTANLGSFVVGLLTIGLSSFLPTFVQGVQGGTPLVAGFALAVQSIGWPLASAFSGRIYLRIGFQRTALLGTFFTVLSGLAFVALRPTSVPVETGGASFLMGIGLGLMSTSIIVAVQAMVGWNRRGVVTGANMFTRMLGSALGAAIYGGLLNGSLAGSIARAPAAVKAHLPAGLNSETLTLGTNTPVIPSVARFLRQVLYTGIHHVFLGILIGAAVGVALILLMPRRSEPLEERPA
jgi:EmrB/QacA subfamily drug resistance transporter